MATGQGFLPRFLITDPLSTIGTRLEIDHEPASDSTLRDWDRRLGTILNAEKFFLDDRRQELAPVSYLFQPRRGSFSSCTMSMSRANRPPVGRMMVSRALHPKRLNRLAALPGFWNFGPI